MCVAHDASPSLMNVRAFAGGAGWGALRERARV